jgi:hypothetical protein
MLEQGVGSCCLSGSLSGWYGRDRSGRFRDCRSGWLVARDFDADGQLGAEAVGRVGHLVARPLALFFASANFSELYFSPLLSAFAGVG